MCWSDCKGSLLPPLKTGESNGREFFPRESYITTATAAAAAAAVAAAGFSGFTVVTISFHRSCLTAIVHAVAEVRSLQLNVADDRMVMESRERSDRHTRGSSAL